jgi:hypothetical protein
MKKKELFETKGWYGEQSGAPAHMLITHKALSIQPIKDKEIVSKVVGNDVRFHDDFENNGKYSRFIEAIRKEEVKMLFGKPCMYGRKISDCEYECNDTTHGGSNKPKSYIIIKTDSKKRKVHTDVNKRKYIIISKNKVFLSSIKGKYKYTV